MYKNISMADVLKLSVTERILFVEDVWDSIAAVPQTVPLTEKEKLELDQRLEKYHKNPSAGSPWHEVRKRVLSQK